MLIFMTYNGYLMLSVTIGAAIGYFAFAKHELSSSENAGGRPICH
jgi:copper transporter 1